MDTLIIETVGKLAANSPVVAIVLLLAYREWNSHKRKKQNGGAEFTLTLSKDCHECFRDSNACLQRIEKDASDIKDEVIKGVATLTAQR